MEDHIVVETKQGNLRGRIRTSGFSNKQYYSFQGIPYGKPPTGELRFKAPKPFDAWEGIRDALEDAPVCVQPAMFVQMDKGDLSQPATTSDGEEDCLYLNVYTNKHPGRVECKRPVMACIHGGGFMGGSSNFSVTGPEYLVEEDVVLVFINYRCGPLGFLSLDTEEVPGNAGLKDQTLALKWVQDNIESFGGDPNNVTIFGISAGGASVHYHLLSPLSKGLFHKAIVQSGYGQNLWAFQQSPKKLALNLANKLGCPSEDPGEVLKFLQSVPKDDMMGACLQIVREKDYMMCCSFAFSPSLELAGTEKFLPDTPSNILKRGEFNKVPCILGICQNEGTLQGVYLMWSQEKEEEYISYINEKSEILVPHFLGLKSTSSEGKEVQKEIWDFYFKEKPLTLDNFHEYVDLHSDLQFNIGFGETRRFLLKNSTCPTYSYLFTNHSRCLCQSLALSGTDLFKRDKETCHGADSFFYYTSMCGIPSPELTDQSRQEVLKHIKIWVKFASSGDPSVEELGVKWDQDSKMKPCYMDIGNVWTMRQGVPFAERMDFWHHLMDKFCKY